MKTIIGHAGSLYNKGKDSYLVIYTDNGVYSVKMDDDDMLWDMYCCDLDVTIIDNDLITLNGADGKRCGPVQYIKFNDKLDTMKHFLQT